MQDQKSEAISKKKIEIAREPIYKVEKFATKIFSFQCKKKYRKYSDN